MSNRQSVFHLISVLLVPAAAFAVNFGALWTSGDNLQYSNYLLFVQWSSFVGSVLGFNLIEIKTSAKAREANISCFLDFLFVINIGVILVFLCFADGSYFSIASIAIASASVALYNSFNLALVFRGNVVGLFVQRISRFSFLIAFFPLLAVFGSQVRNEAIFWTYTLSFFLPALLYLKDMNLNKFHESIAYTLRFLWTHRKLVSVRTMSYAIDMALLPIIVLAINNASKVRHDVSWFYFLTFFGVGLPLITVIKQFVGERFRISLMSKNFAFREIPTVKFAVAAGFIFVVTGCVGFLLKRSAVGAEWDIFSAFFIGWIFLGVFVLSLASGITSVMLQHLSLHRLDLISNLTSFILTAFAFLFGGTLGLTLIDVVFVLAISLGIKYFWHSCAVLYYFVEDN